MTSNVRIDMRFCGLWGSVSSLAFSISAKSAKNIGSTWPGMRKWISIQYLSHSRDGYLRLYHEF